MSVRKTTVLCCVCLLLAVGAVAVLFPFGVFSPPPSYDYREEQFTGSQDWQAYLQLEGIDPDNPPAFPVHHYDQAVKLVIVEPGAFYRAVREGTLRNLLQDSDRYEWIIPRSYHGSAQDIYRFWCYDTQYYVPRALEWPTTIYQFVPSGYVAELLKQAEITEYDFVVVFGFLLNPYENYLYVEQNGKPYIAIFTNHPEDYPGLEGSGQFYPFEKFQDVTAEKCAQGLDLILFQAIAGTGLPSVDWYFNYFNGNYFDKRELAHMIATEY